MASPDPCAPPLGELRGGWQALSDARTGVGVSAGGLGYAPHPFFNAKNFLDQQTLVYFLSEQHVLSDSYREGANKPDRLVQFTTRTSMSEALQTLADYRILSGPILDAVSGEYMGLADVGTLLGALIEEVYGSSLVGADVAMSDAEFLSKVRAPPPLPALLEAGRSWAARPLADLPTAGDLWFHGDAESTLLEVVRAGFRVSYEWPSRPSPLAPRRAAANPVHQRVAVFDILPMDEDEEGEDGEDDGSESAGAGGSGAEAAGTGAGAAGTGAGAGGGRRRLSQGCAPGPAAPSTEEAAESVHGSASAALPPGLRDASGERIDRSQVGGGGAAAGAAAAAAPAAASGGVSPGASPAASRRGTGPGSPPFLSGGAAPSAPASARASASPPPPPPPPSSAPAESLTTQLDALIERRARIDSLASASSNALSRLALSPDGAHGPASVPAPTPSPAASHSRLADLCAGTVGLGGEPSLALPGGLSPGGGQAEPPLAAPGTASTGSPPPPLAALHSHSHSHLHSQGPPPPAGSLSSSRLDVLPWVGWAGRSAPPPAAGTTAAASASACASACASASASAVPRVPPPQSGGLLRTSGGSLVSDLLGGGGLDGRSSGLVKCLSATDLTAHGAGRFDADLQPTQEQREAAAAAAARLLAATAGNARAFELPQPPAEPGLGRQTATLGSLATAVAASTGNLAAYMQGASANLAGARAGWATARGAGAGTGGYGGLGLGLGLAGGYAQGAFSSVPSGLHVLQTQRMQQQVQVQQLQQQQQQLQLQQQQRLQRRLQLQREASGGAAQPPLAPASPAPSSSVADLSEDDDDDDDVVEDDDDDDLDDEELDEALDDEDDDEDERGEGASSAWRAPDRAPADESAALASAQGPGPAPPASFPPPPPPGPAPPPPQAAAAEAHLTPRGSFAGQSSGLSGPSLSARSLSSEARSLSGGQPFASAGSALAAQLLAQTLPGQGACGGSPRGAEGAASPRSSAGAGAGPSQSAPPPPVTSPRSASQRRGRSAALRSLDAALRATKPGKERGKERAASLGRVSSPAALHAKAKAEGASGGFGEPSPGALPGSPPSALSGLFPLHAPSEPAGLRVSLSAHALPAAGLPAAAGLSATGLHASLSAQHLAALQHLHQQHLQNHLNLQSAPQGQGHMQMQMQQQQQMQMQMQMQMQGVLGSLEAGPSGVRSVGATPPPPAPPPSRLSSTALHALGLPEAPSLPLPLPPSLAPAPSRPPRRLGRSASGWQIRAVISQTDVVRLLLANVDRLDLSFDCSIEQLGLVQGAGQVSSVPADTPALAAFALLQRHALSGLALVDERNRLVGSLAASDLRGVDARRVALLRLPALQYVAFRAAHVMAARDPDDAVVRAACEGDMRVVADAIARAGDRVPQLVEVSPKDSLRRVAELLVAHTKRRVYVVDDLGVAIGVVTPTDILRLVSA